MNTLLKNTALSPLLVDGIIWTISRCYHYITSKWNDSVYFKITVDGKANPRIQLAITEEIRSRGLHKLSNHIEIIDAFDATDCTVKDGMYELKIGKNNVIYIEIKNSFLYIKAASIYPWKTFADMNDLMSCIDDLYRKYNQPSKIMMFYTFEQDSWCNVIIREPRSYHNIILTESMTGFIEDLDNFFNIETREIYRKSGWTYKRGYLLHGKEGTMKSTMAEMVAHKYNMTVYLLSLNSKDMNDTRLINLLSKVPRKSLIVIDEIDKQLDAITKNTTVFVSTAGLLTAIDGPQRLNEEVIVILTANRSNFLPEADLKSLLRPGRIDKIIEFK
jgi:hypothetical protein